jgi:hypothetical protein
MGALQLRFVKTFATEYGSGGSGDPTRRVLCHGTLVSKPNGASDANAALRDTTNVNRRFARNAEALDRFKAKTWKPRMNTKAHESTWLGALSIRP